MNLQIPKYMNRSLLLLLAGAMIILLFALVFIIPSQRAMANLEAEIGVTKFKIETQEKLGPLYKGLTEKLNKIDKKAALPPTSPIARNKLGGFSGTISELAKKSKLVVLSVYPDTQSGDSGAVYIASIRGNFTDFRNFLVELGKLTYLEAVQEIHIHTVSGVREFNIKMKLLVS